MAKNKPQPYTDVYEGPQSKLELQYIDEYLSTQGISWADVVRLSEGTAKLLMIAACRFAMTRLAEHEARAQFRKEIHIE